MTKLSKVLKSASEHKPLDSRPQGAIIEAPVYDAKVEAERILREARAEAERLRTQAQAEGRERGLAAVTALLASARTIALRAEKDAQSDLSKLAVRIAEKILGRELSLKPDAIIDVVATALEHVGDPRAVEIRVSPEDLQALEGGRPRLIDRLKEARSIALRADSNVPRGGCVIETELGVVDARLSTQLEAIEQALRGDSR